MSSEAQNQSQEQQQDAGKELKKFEGFKKKLVALLSGDEVLKKKGRTAKTDVQKAMEILVAEKKATKIEEIKKGAGDLIEKYIAFQDFQSQKKKEFEKAVEEKIKEFNKEAATLFGKMEGVEELERTYYAALQGASTSPAGEGEES